jgi:peroxiredoxin
MKKPFAIAIAFALALSFGPQLSAVKVGEPAPAFTGTDNLGKTHSLSDFKGKLVVLEWHNQGCPYVGKHYNSGNMPATQKQARAKGVVWLAVNSTAVDAYDYRKPADLASWLKTKDAVPTATLMDVDGKVGRAYGARTTPHMYLIDPQGKLVYAGAIDSIPSASASDIKTATNYINQALDEALAGKPLSKPTSQAYGCSIKYANAG